MTNGELYQYIDFRNVNYSNYFYQYIILPAKNNFNALSFSSNSCQSYYLTNYIANTVWLTKNSLSTSTHSPYADSLYKRSSTTSTTMSHTIFLMRSSQSLSSFLTLSNSTYNSTPTIFTFANNQTMYSSNAKHTIYQTIKEYLVFYRKSSTVTNFFTSSMITENTISIKGNITNGGKYFWYFENERAVRTEDIDGERIIVTGTDFNFRNIYTTTFSNYPNHINYKATNKYSSNSNFVYSYGSYNSNSTSILTSNYFTSSRTMNTSTNTSLTTSREFTSSHTLITNNCNL